jgi:hypothetical protein
MFVRSTLGDFASEHGGQVITSVATAGTAATSLLPAAGAAAAVPVVGAAVAGVILALSLIFGRKGPQQKIASTRIVDELEPQLQANVAAYLAEPTAANQAAALQNFDAAWAYLVSESACGSDSLGNPGKACISDRQRGGKWDWFAMYRDPIANTPPADGGSIINSVSQSPLLLIAASLALLGVLL